MRIGYVYAYQAYPPRGGNGVHAYQLIKEFTAAGHQVVTPFDATPPEVEHIPSPDQFLAGIDVLYVRVDGVALRTRPRQTALMEQWDGPTVWEINAPANEAMAFSWLGGERSPESPIAQAADHLRRRLHAARRAWVVAQDERLRRRLARGANAAVCVSQALVRYAREGLGIENALVMENGCDPTESHPDIPPIPLPGVPADALKVLYSGSPRYPWQGLDVLKATIELSRQQQENIVFLLLVNEGLASSAGPNVVHFDRVPHEEVARHITAADVCAYVPPDYSWSKWGYHNSPMKVFDYMACGRPVVLSDFGQMKTLVDDYQIGVTCDPTADGLLASLKELAGSPDQRQRMGSNGRRAVVEHFNWTSIARRTLEVMEGVL